MRLDELLGVKKYSERTLDDVLRDFEKAGGSWANGNYGTVLLHPSWNYVYKFFTDDVCYLRFIRWAARNPNPSLPRVLSKVRRITPFYRRHKSADQIYVVKLERLKQWSEPLAVRNYGGISRFLEHVSLHPDWYANATPPSTIYSDYDQDGRRREVAYKRWERVYHILEDYPELRPLAQFYPTLMTAVECSPDIHAANIMQRDDGSLVYTDPFWEGETPYQAELRAMRAEMDYDHDEPDERDYVSGGERYKRPKKPKPYKPFGRYDGGEDMPF